MPVWTTSAAGIYLRPDNRRKAPHVTHDPIAPIDRALCRFGRGIGPAAGRQGGNDQDIHEFSWIARSAEPQATSSKSPTARSARSQGSECNASGAQASRRCATRRVDQLLELERLRVRRHVRRHHPSSRRAGGGPDSGVRRNPSRVGRGVCARLRAWPRDRMPAQPRGVGAAGARQHRVVADRHHGRRGRGGRGRQAARTQRAGNGACDRYRWRAGRPAIARCMRPCARRSCRPTRRKPDCAPPTWRRADSARSTTASSIRSDFSTCSRSSPIRPFSRSGSGSEFKLLRNTYKPYPCGIVIYGIIDSCLDIRSANAFDPRADRQGRHRRQPGNADAHGASATSGYAARRATEPASLGRGRADRPGGRDRPGHRRAAARSGGREPARRIEATADDSFAHDQGKVTVYLRDGRMFEQTTLQCSGGVSRPLSDAQLCGQVLERGRPKSRRRACTGGARPMHRSAQLAATLAQSQNRLLRHRRERQDSRDKTCRRMRRRRTISTTW